MMKMWKLFGLAFLLAAGFAACSDEDENTPGGDDGGGTETPVAPPTDTVPLTLTAQMRTAAQAAPWAAGDTLGVLADTSNWAFVTEAGGTPATFEGRTDGSTAYYGFYPYQPEARLEAATEGTRILAQLPEEQTAVADGFDRKLNLAAGTQTEPGGTLLSFRLLCGYLTFNLDGCRGEVSSITLHSTTGIAGALTVDADARAITSAEGTSVTLSAAGGGLLERGVDYRFIVAPGTLEGISFTFVDGDGVEHHSDWGGTLEVDAGGEVDLLAAIEGFVPEDLAWGVIYEENWAHRLVDVLQQLDEADARQYAMQLGQVTLSDEGRQMFQELADGWCAGLTTDEEKTRQIFTMMQRNLVQAGGGDQSPEQVWADGGGICQGWADLLKVFLHSQGIPCFGANGYVNPTEDYYDGLAHAWTFAFIDGEWYLADAMWGTFRPCSEVDAWGADRKDAQTGNIYQPQFINVVMAEDGNFRYNFDRGVNIYGILPGSGSEVTVPDVCEELGGLEVTSFNLMEMVPDEVQAIRLGTNISYLGEEETNLDNGCPNLRNYAQHVTRFEVPAANRTYWSDDEGNIYLGGREAPLHWPGRGNSE